MKWLAQDNPDKKRIGTQHCVQTRIPQSHAGSQDALWVPSVVHDAGSLLPVLFKAYQPFPHRSWVQRPNEIYSTGPQDDWVSWVPGVIARNVCQAYGDPTDKYLQKVITFTQGSFNSGQAQRINWAGSFTGMRKRNQQWSFWLSKKNMPNKFRALS